MVEKKMKLEDEYGGRISNKHPKEPLEMKKKDTSKTKVNLIHTNRRVDKDTN